MVSSGLAVKGEMLTGGDGSQMVCEDLTFVPGLYKIFDEILVNARDHVVRLHAKKIANRDTKINLVSDNHQSIYQYNNS